MARPRRELELLAPARDAEIGIEAVNHGADAVYIGGPAFGARAQAGNELHDLERLVRHAHRYQARIFVTLNTILRDDELEPARRLAHALYGIGVDALIVQDMGLLELDLPPIQLHASTQADIRTVAKAVFLQRAGFSQMVLARELGLAQVQAVHAALLQAATQDGAAPATVEFFVHGALCVAYSGQCYVSHAQTGRSANRGDCSQACRLPYTVTDASGAVVAHERHVLSLKDNNQTGNLAALVDAGVRSFKIEGRYKDMGYVKNITAHYRQQLDALLAQRPSLRAASSGRCSYTFAPDPQRNFNRGSTDYFVNGRRDDIGSFDSPKHAGLPLGRVLRLAGGQVEIELDEGAASIGNGDGIAWYDLQRQLTGLRVNLASPLDADGRRWRIEPNEPVAELKDLRPGTTVTRNREMAWDRLLARPSAQRRIGVRWRVAGGPAALRLQLADEDGGRAEWVAAVPLDAARDPERAAATLQACLEKLGGTEFGADGVDFAWSAPCFVPASMANEARREAVERLRAARLAALPRLPRAQPAEPPAAYPEDTLTYLANVYNQKAHDFYARHGVGRIAAAYESHEEPGEVSLMITRHCVRFSLSLCPKQAKGVIGVQGSVRAEPLQIAHGGERLTLRFDCKACEMHVVGRIRRPIREEAPTAEIRWYRARP